VWCLHVIFSGFSATCHLTPNDNGYWFIKNSLALFEDRKE